VSGRAWLAAATLATLAPLATAAQDSEPEAAPRAGATAEQGALAIRGGVDYLRATQNADGSWGGVKNATFTSSFANPATYKTWQIGASALATRALLEVGHGDEDVAAVERGLDFLMANADPVRPAEWDVDNVWALVYGLDAVARALQHPRYAAGPRREKLVAAGQSMLAGLKRYQSPRGGWGYYSSPDAGWRPEWATSFTTAVGVLAIVEARAAGLAIDEKVYGAAVAAVKRARLPNGAYEYSVNALPDHLSLESINQVKGSLGRIQVCNLALYRAGAGITRRDLVEGLEQFVKHHKFLDVARNKPIPHEAYYANAAYFYLFAHYYAAQVLGELSTAERAKFAPHVEAGILAARQKDGAMWDFWIAASSKAYGTAFGTLGLEHALRVAQ
jgi:hypothetical protein